MGNQMAGTMGNRRVQRGNRVGHLQPELEAIHTKSEAWVARASEVEMASLKKRPGWVEIASIETEDSPLFVLTIAASNEVLYFVR
jgi:hypothetical protein